MRPADGSGSQRLYGFGDLVELRIIKRLLDAGVSLQRIREAIAHLQAETPDGSLSDLTLMSDGSRIYACHSGEEVIDVLAKGQAVFGIAVGRVIEDTEGDVAMLPAGDATTGEMRGAGHGTGHRQGPAGQAHRLLSTRLQGPALLALRCSALCLRCDLDARRPGPPRSGRRVLVRPRRPPESPAGTRRPT